MPTRSNVSLTSSDESDSDTEVLGLNELHRVIRHMYHEVQRHGDTIASLNEWVNGINPATYEKEDPWPQDLIDAYERYKQCVVLITPARQAYMKYFQRVKNERLGDTSETRMKELELCINWGQAALSATEARLNVLVTYSNAFDNIDTINGHITQAGANRDSAQKAVDKAGVSYRSKH
ncbi:hypothetical protein AbraIFM66951_010568 [Aspergillus brasiliensis]|nr:hypothetical protein AbraIFM66951_010568 [Aspergillus brasiliensis]